METTNMAHKILIADDEPISSFPSNFSRRRRVFVVAVAGDGERPLAKVAGFQPDLLLLDVMMPKKSGFEVCEALRADNANAALKIVMPHRQGRGYRSRQGPGPGGPTPTSPPFSTKDLVAKVKAYWASRLIPDVGKNIRQDDP